jgi:PTH1 family peptidyl-tRNA hydrolase
MNNSGLAVRNLCDYYRISSQEILVVVDDFAIPLGALRLRERGSAGGHNGLSSIIEHLGTSDFPRLRLGIGPVPPRMDPADYVLGQVRNEEKETVRRMIEEAARTVENALASGLAKAVSQINKQVSK